ncbi:hypothetical protein HHL28_17095 [Aerophototrophica crusticola]|uniref:Uncharacterized protein n=1 Tax=Aerophototrophica crusticola TaxID=1709002 RepID=A0A858RB36_9PROT|nr:hypothetical protein HHL28_17095 [Rhodospirillaceae bacterium B3]
MPVSPDLLAQLEARYDGPAPREAVAALRAGGRAAWVDGLKDGTRRAAARRCAESRLAISRRRSDLPGAAVLGDAWLSRLVVRLAMARGRAVAGVAEGLGHG